MMTTLTRHLPSFAAAAVACAMLPAQTHTHGDAVGSLTPSSALVWTRASTRAQVTVRYATNPQLNGAVETSPVVADAAEDYIGKVRLTGLSPNTRYWFATKLTDPQSPGNFVVGPTGSFTTPPSPGTAIPVRVVVSGDTRLHADYGIFQRMASHGAHFFAHLGDMPYADGAVTLPDYWAKHREVRNEPRLIAFLRDTPLIGTWDDHEVSNDWDIDMDPTKVLNGTRAWKHWFPIPSSSPEIYRSLRWGDALEYFVLDTRSHRGDNQAADLPGKPCLGTVQLAWLENALRASTATFKVIGTSVPLRFGTTGPDHWEGYMRERAELLAFIQTTPIDNVVFVSADQHWAASYHHREGVRDFQTGPDATGTRTPQTTNDPQQRWIAVTKNYGLMTIDPAATPPTLTFDWRDANGSLLRREVVAAGPRARVQLTADVPEARFALEGGPFHAAASGAEVRLPYHEAGSYTARFAPLRGVDVDGRPADLDLTIPPGAVAHVAGDYRDAPASATNRVLFADGFEAPLSGYTIVDEGAGGPSAWFTDGGALVQNSNIYTSTGGIAYPGTMAVTGDASWTDYTMRVRCKSIDDDGIGFVFRYRGPNDFYRFSLDSQRGFRRLVSRRGGVYRELAADATGYARYMWYDFEIVAVGDRIVVRQDGRTVFDVTDANRDHQNGKVGFYSWGNMASLFDDLVVRQGDATVSGTLFHDDFGDGTPSGWTFIDQVAGQSSTWSESGGTLNQTANINDGDLDRNHIPKLGTLGIAGPSVADATITVDAFNSDDDAIGVVARFVDGRNYYRFSMDSERGYRRLAKVVNGAWSLLWQDLAQGYSTGAWHVIRLTCVGTRIDVWLDGQRLTTVTDGSHAAGRSGLYCWGSTGARFDDFDIGAPRPDRAILASIGDGGTTELRGRAPASSGRPYRFVLAAARTPGIPLNLLYPGDPRVLELAPDPLFFATLTPPPALFPGFIGTLDGDGRATARIVWPPLPGLRGTVMYVSGWTADGGSMRELWPTVEVVVP